MKAFVKLMMEVKTKAALLLITKQDRGSIPHINNIIHSELSTPYTVLDTLKIVIVLLLLIASWIS